jgi:hypothetical protein
MNEVPALALTSEYAAELVAAITHTPEDCPEIINPSRLVTVAIALHDVLLHLEQHMLQMKI